MDQGALSGVLQHPQRAVRAVSSFTRSTMAYQARKKLAELTSSQAVNQRPLLHVVIGGRTEYFVARPARREQTSDSRHR